MARRASSVRLALVLLLGAATFLLGDLEAVRMLDEAIRERLAPRPDDAGDPGGVVLAELGETALLKHGAWPWDAADVIELAAGLARARPSAIGLGPELTAVLSRSGGALQTLRRETGGIPLVLSLRPSRRFPESLKARANVVERSGLLWGVWELTPDADGVFRHLAPDAAGTDFIRRLAAAAQAGQSALVQAGAGLSTDPGSALRVRFSGSSGTVPRVPLERLASGELPAGTVAGRPVIAAVTAESSARFLPTPTTRHGPGMTEPEAAAHAVDTLLLGTAVAEPGVTFRAAVHLGAGLLFFNLCRWAGMVSGYLLLAGMLGVTIATAVALELHSAIPMPVVPLLALEVALFALVRHFKRQDQDRQLRELVLGFAGGRFGRSRIEGASWSDGLVALGQYVRSEAMALLSIETPAGRPRVEAAAGFGDGEMAAILETCPGIPPDRVGRLELRETGRSAVLVPAAWRGRLVGVWAVAPPSGATSIGLSEALLLALAADLARREAGRALLDRSRGGRSGGLLTSLMRDRKERDLEDVEALGRQIIRERDFLLDMSDRLDVGVLTADLMGEVTYVNAAFSKLFGRSREELARASFFDVAGQVLLREDEKLRDVLAKILEGRGAIEREHSGDRDGPALLLAWTALTAGAGSGRKPVGHFCTAHDVTRHRALDRLKSQMIDIATLKVRNLLAVVQGYSEDFVEFTGTIRDAVDSGRTIHRTSLDLARIFNDFESISRFGLVSGELQRVPVDLIAIVGEAIGEQQAFANQKGVKIFAEPPGILDAARADPVYLRRAIASLLYQSLLNCPSGSSVKATLAQDDESVRVTIVDDGNGLPEEAAARFFDEPAEGESARSAWETAGQLLPHEVKRALAEMNGLVEAEAQIGQGTVFRIRVPRM